MGRRTRIKREDRKCHCGEVEDEEHFLQKCNSYYDIRAKYNIRNATITKILNDGAFQNYIKELYESRKLYHK